MYVFDIITAHTDDSTIKTTVPELVGRKLPHAFYINYNSHGYAKFKIDHRDLDAFD